MTAIPGPASKPYRRPRGWLRRTIGAPVATFLLRRLPGPGAVLEVGGAGGRTRRIPLGIWPRDGVDHIVALFGITPWVRDVRSGSPTALWRRGKKTPVRLDELSPAATAEYLTWYSKANSRQAGRYLGVTGKEVGPDEAVVLAERHPVFRVRQSP